MGIGALQLFFLFTAFSFFWSFPLHDSFGEAAVEIEEEEIETGTTCELATGLKQPAISLNALSMMTMNNQLFNTLLPYNRFQILKMLHRGINTLNIVVNSNVLRNDKIISFVTHKR